MAVGGTLLDAGFIHFGSDLPVRDLQGGLGGHVIICPIPGWVLNEGARNLGR